LRHPGGRHQLRGASKTTGLAKGGLGGFDRPAPPCSAGRLWGDGYGGAQTKKPGAAGKPFFSGGSEEGKGGLFVLTPRAPGRKRRWFAPRAAGQGGAAATKPRGGWARSHDFFAAFANRARFPGQPGGWVLPHPPVCRTPPGPAEPAPALRQDRAHHTMRPSDPGGPICPHRQTGGREKHTPGGSPVGHSGKGLGVRAPATQRFFGPAQGPSSFPTARAKSRQPPLFFPPPPPPLCGTEGSPQMAQQAPRLARTGSPKVRLGLDFFLENLAVGFIFFRDPRAARGKRGGGARCRSSGGRREQPLSVGVDGW